MMAFQAGGPHAQDRGLEAVAYAWDELSRVPAVGAVGEAAGQERAHPHGEAVSRRAARRRSRHRLLHVPDVERLSGPLREPRHRQRGRRQAASGRDPAARDHRADRARGARRSGHRSQRRDAVRARGRQQRRAAARAAPRGPHHRLHRQQRQRPLARGARAAGAGVHREGRREPDHRRQRGRHEGRRAQRRLLALALHGPDVHGAAEHLRAARRHRHRGRPPVVRRGGRGGGRRRAQAAGRPRARGRGAGRRAERRRAAAARSGPFARQGRARHAVDRASRVSRRAGPHAAHRQARHGRPRDVPQRVVRADRVRDRDGADTDESLAIARDAARGARRAHVVGLLDERRRHRARRSTLPRTPAWRCRSISPARCS